MGNIVIAADEFAAVAPEIVFDQFGRLGEGGWLFGAACDQVRVGAAVNLQAPLGGGSSVEIVGCISELRRPLGLVISHDQPWRGRIRLRFRPVPGGTKIRLSAEIDAHGLEWLMRRMGLPVRDGASTGSRIGVLTSRSGSGNLFAAAVGNVARLAVDEINADGGVSGRQIELMLADDATDPGTGAVEALRLERAGCDVIFLATTSATYEAVSVALEGREVLVVQANMNEGGGESRLRIRLGERPGRQLAVAAEPLMRIAGGRRWFLAGNNYVWPRSVNLVARTFLPERGALLVGERYARLGTRDFGPIIEEILASGADIVLNTFVGADGAAFERQCHAMGLRDQAVSLGPAMDEVTLERIGERAAHGIFGVSGYFQHLETERNGTLLQRYRAGFGPWAPSLSTQSESVFEAIHVWAAAARRVGDTDSTRVAEEIRRGRYEVPRGTIALDGVDVVEQQLHLATTRGSTFESIQ